MRWAITSVSVWERNRCPSAAKVFRSSRKFSMIPLCTTASFDWQSTCGWALASDGRPWVAHRVWPTPRLPAGRPEAINVSRFSILPVVFLTSSDSLATVAIPAESYPRYSNRRRPGRRNETASRWPTYPTIPHIAVGSLRGFQLGAIEVDGDAALRQIDRDHEKACLGIPTDEDAFDVGERPMGDAHALPFPEVGMGEDREV